jgi:hypothetical protein
MWSEPWYRALIENARDDAGELRRIEQYLRAVAKPLVEQRKELLRLIEEYLRTAAPGRPPRSESEALLWADAARSIHDTTAYDEANEHILTFIDGPRWIPKELLWPTLRAVREIGDSGTIEEIVEKVIELEGFTEEQ